MYLYCKRVLDIIASTLGIIVLSPIFVIIFLLVKLTSKGPVVFTQQRVGKDCKIFKIYKFRTMRIETEKDGLILNDMQRVTKTGDILRKLSLDELPQMFNIIKGDMSFIGPRPLLVEYIPRYSEFQNRRHEILPGITGWAQVNGRNTISWECRFQFDVWYVDNMTFLLDIKIVWLTICKVLSHKDVNQTNQNTMTVFMGNQEAEPEE